MQRKGAHAARKLGLKIQARNLLKLLRAVAQDAQQFQQIRFSIYLCRVKHTSAYNDPGGKFMLRGFSALTAATVLGLSAVSISATSSDAKSSSNRFLCEAFGAGDTDLSAQYEERVQKKGTRAEFRAEFETSTTDGFVAGQPVVFLIDTVVVGMVPLGSVGAGQLEAELRLDTKAQGRGFKRPFQPTFPVIQAGSVLEAAVGGRRVMGCLLL